MDLRQLRCFLAVAEELHFGRAAERLNMSQPPLSQHIRNLEAELGALLFTRTNRRVALTEAGRVLRAHAQGVVASAELAASATRRAARGRSGHLAVGFLHATAYTILPAILRRFRSRYPDVDLRLEEASTSSQMTALAEGRLDVGLLWGAIRSERIASETLCSEPLVVALASDHPLAARATLRPTDLGESGLIAFARQPGDVGLAALVSAVLRDADVSPPVVQVANTIHTAVALTAAGAGLAIVPASAETIGLPGLTFRELVGVQRRAVTVLALRDPASPLQQAFRSEAMAALRAQEEPGFVPAV